MRLRTRLYATLGLLALVFGLFYFKRGEPDPSRLAEANVGGGADRTLDATPRPSVVREPVANVALSPVRHETGLASVWLQESHVTVSVLHENGDPGVGIGVFLAGLDGALPAQLVTDAQGRVVFGGVFPGLKAISTDRGGTLLVEVVGGRDSDEDLYLPPGHSPRVRAVRTDGVGIALASVFVSYQRDVPRGRIIAATNAEGWCTLPCVEPGRLVWIEAKGYLPSYAQPVVDSRDVTVVLEEGGVELCGGLFDGMTHAGVRGTVTLEGYKTAGSVVRPSGTTRVVLPPPPRLVESDDEGGFCLQASDYAGLRLRAAACGYAAREVALTPEILRSRSVRIDLDRAGTLVGVVRTEAGAALPRCRVRTLFTDGRACQDVETELDGHFVLRDAPLGEAWVEARGPDGYSGRAKTIIGDITEVEILCSNEDAIVVEVLAPGRIPMPDCLLGIVERQSGDERFLRVHHLGTSNAEGVLRVRADRLYDGCLIGAFRNGLDTFPIHTAKWSRELSRLELLLPSHAHVGDLRIQWTNFDEHEDLAVFLRSEQEQTIISRTVDSKGACEFVGLPLGAYLVLVAKGNEEYSLGIRDVFDGTGAWLSLDARRLGELERSSVLGWGPR